VVKHCVPPAAVHAWISPVKGKSRRLRGGGGGGGGGHGKVSRVSRYKHQKKGPDLADT